MNAFYSFVSTVPKHNASLNNGSSDNVQSASIMTQSLPPTSSTLKVLKTTKVTPPAPVRLRPGSSQQASNNNQQPGNVKPSLNPNRASYPGSTTLPTVTENR